MDAPSLPDAARQNCRNHPASPARGLCVRCHERFCEVCITKLRGRNHCTRCIGELGAPPQERKPASQVAWGALFAIGTLSITLSITLWALVWLLLEVGLS